MHFIHNILFDINRINFSKKRLRKFAIFVVMVVGIFFVFQYLYSLSNGVAQKTTFSFDSVGEPTPILLDRLANKKQQFSESGEYYAANGMTLRKEFSATDEAKGGKPLVQFVAKGIPVEFKARGILVPTVQQKENNVTYRNAYTDTDIAFEGFIDNLAEKITLYSAAAPRDFMFELSSPQQLSFEKDAKGGVIAKNNGKMILYIQPPIARDAAGKKLSYEYDVQQENNGYVLAMRSSDVKQFDRVQYPVSIE